MAKVKNLNGTSDNKAPENKTWREWWEDKKGEDFDECSRVGCRNDAEVGAHVKKVNSSDNRWYIVPLCTSCNNKTEAFEVNDSDLEPVNQ